MEKLELKHLAGYLPYGLKGIAFEGDNNGEIENVIGYQKYKNGDEIITDYDNITVDAFKPILRPLSDLTKEIEVNGEKFVPIEKLTKISDLHGNYELRFENNIFVLWDKENEWYRINDNNFSLFQKLYEWHFDIYGLIPKGLAIDINTLK